MSKIMFINTVAIFFSMVIITNYGSSGEPLLSENIVECQSFYGKSLPGIYNQSLIAKGKINMNIVQIHFKLCDEFKIDDVCPEGSSACLKNYNGYVIQSFGKNFELDTDKSLFYVTNPTQCTHSKNHSVSIILRRNQYREQFISYISDDKCEYEINLPHPQHLPKCTMYFRGKYINLNPTFNRSFVYNDDNQHKHGKGERQFSITPCAANPICNQTDVNACEIILDKENKKSVSPLSVISQFNLFLKDNRLLFAGHFSNSYTGKIIKKVEVIVVCNWLKNSMDKSNALQYVKKPIQGKLYSFQLTSSYGCIKVAPTYILRHNHYIYNLAGIYQKHPQPWHIQNSKTHFYLQIGGPLHLNGAEYSQCTNTYAQVCENNGTVANRGSVIRPLQLYKDIIKVSIENGPNAFYRTFVDFYCDNKEYGPQYITGNGNDTYFIWRTPEACPEIDRNKCDANSKRITPNSSPSYPCEFVNSSDNDILYNLTALSNKSQQSKLEYNGTYEFIFNICGNATNEQLINEAPCLNDVSIIMKNLKEYNKKYRITALGKFSTYTLLPNGHLNIKYDTGTVRNMTEYSSEIVFKCNDKEKIELTSQVNGHYTFLWLTAHACPKNITALNSLSNNNDNDNERTFLSNNVNDTTELNNLMTYNNDFPESFTTLEEEKSEAIILNQTSMIAIITVGIIVLISLVLVSYIYRKKIRCVAPARSIYYAKCGDV